MIDWLILKGGVISLPLFEKNNMKKKYWNEYPNEYDN